MKTVRFHTSLFAGLGAAALVALIASGCGTGAAMTEAPEAATAD